LGLGTSLSLSVYEAGAWGVLDDGSNPLFWPSALLLNVIALPASNMGEVWGYSPGFMEGGVNNRIAPV